MFERIEKMLVEYNWKPNTNNMTTKMRKGQYSINIGKTCHWNKPGRPILPTLAMKANKSQIWDECGRLFPEHNFDCIMINKNFKCPPHKDRNNIGDSIIFGVGNYNGGDLMIEGEGQCILYSPYIFNGAEKEHYVDEWEGDRYTVVLCCSKFKSMATS